eukprot:CAMPEP_0114137628 /NCGR_PEP_ID=MMETSP0043_2-20121206/15873_1 /TAXON_ID=464988 /ORGANISM="Hemiselmis andersenii, Strain CCMP644" /LENGTH=281 /DNA_ID=CAMNT_0001231509 /DNA_START=302 /DNA_END=1144 /DNA_ORIENTATION=-
MRAWLEENDPSMLDTLRRGMSRQELDESLASDDISLPACVRAMYRVCGGQDDEKVPLEFKRSMGTSNWMGLFGGYSFYDKPVSLRFLTIPRAIALRRHILQQCPSPPFPPGESLTLQDQFPFACSFQWLQQVELPSRTVCVRVSTGDVCSVGNEVSRPRGVALHQQATASQHAGGLVPWLEAFVERLCSGYYRKSRLVKDLDQSVSISLFPRAGEFSCESVTRGVRVRASSIFVPEMSFTAEPHSFYFFAYSIRFQMLESITEGGKEVLSCQLVSRHFAFT